MLQQTLDYTQTRPKTCLRSRRRWHQIDGASNVIVITSDDYHHISANEEIRFCHGQPD